MTVTVRIIPILAVAITIGPSLAYGSPACMTESEARAKFPKSHLIWVGTNHCWKFETVPEHSRPSLTAEHVPSPRPVLAAAPLPTARPVLMGEPVPSSRSEINSGCIHINVPQCKSSPGQ